MDDPEDIKTKDFNELLHKLNQPLTAINNYAQAGNAMLAAGHTDSARLRELFDKIAEQAARTAAISRELRDAGPASPSSD